MAKRGEEAIVALARETGTSRLFSEFNLAFCIQVLREAAAAITRPIGELLPTSIPGAYSMAQRIPFGVVGAISPWNAPLVLGMRSIAIPLAVGNTVVMKPSEDAPITCGLLLADVLAEAGLPAGVLIIHINDQGIADEPMAPFGGVKHSGYGKFGGTAGIESFTEQRWVTIQHSGRPSYPF
jgi:acyl-CoA reductase-like NAD-dependent aldehyde dehydrogenase